MDGGADPGRSPRAGSAVLTWGITGEGKRRRSEEGALDQESKLLGLVLVLVGAAV